MASFTVNFEDGSSHVYDNVPDDVTDAQVQERASSQFSKKIADIGSGTTPASEVNPSNPADASNAQTNQGGPVAPDLNIGEKAIAAAQIPFQIAAEHPVEAGLGIGAWKAYQLANKFVTGKNVEAKAANDIARMQAETALEHQRLQYLKEANRMARAPGAPAPVEAPAVRAPAIPEGPPLRAPVAPAAPAAESITGQMQRFAAQKVLGPAYEAAQTILRNPIINNPATRFIASKPVQAAVLAVQPGNADQNYGTHFPMVGPMRGSEINPNTGRPWTQQ